MFLILAAIGIIIYTWADIRSSDNEYNKKIADLDYQLKQLSSK